MCKEGSNSCPNCGTESEKIVLNPEGDDLKEMKKALEERRERENVQKQKKEKRKEKRRKPEEQESASNDNSSLKKRKGPSPPTNPSTKQPSVALSSISGVLPELKV